MLSCQFLITCYTIDYRCRCNVIISARQHICSALYAIAVRPPVRLSVRPSVTQVDQSKTIEARIMQLLPQHSPVLDRP